MDDLKDTLMKAMDQRHSRRKYAPTPLDPAAVVQLSGLIDEYNKKENLDMRLILNNGEAFNGLSKSYGMFSGVQNYIVQIGSGTDALEPEKLGYYGELLVLHATALGLGTCWVGGTFDKAGCPVTLRDNEKIVCTIVVGNVADTLSPREKLIHWGIRRKSKPIEQMYTANGEVPAWFVSGMDAVAKAPSAVNRQPVMFCYQDGVVTASVEKETASMTAIDLGIAKLHFELGAGGGKWTFGNGAAFEKS